MTQVSRPRGAERVYVLQGGAQHVPVEHDGDDGLVVRSGGDIGAQGPGGQEVFELLLAGQALGLTSDHITSRTRSLASFACIMR